MKSVKVKDSLKKFVISEEQRESLVTWDLKVLCIAMGGLDKSIAIVVVEQNKDVKRI